MRGFTVAFFDNVLATLGTGDCPPHGSHRWESIFAQWCMLKTGDEHRNVITRGCVRKSTRHGIHFSDALVR